MGRVVKKPEQRKKEIVATAQKLFLEKQYESTSMNDVVQSAGIAKGTVYHYFKSKEELLDAVVESLVDDYLLKLNERLAAQGEGCGALVKLQVLASALDVSNESAEGLEQMHQRGNAILHLRQLAVLVNRLSPIIAEVIAQGCEEGVFKTVQPLEATEVLLTAFQFLTDAGVYSWSSAELKRRKAAMPGLAETLLGAPKGSLRFLGDDGVI